MMTELQPTPLDTWRQLARRFYTIRVQVEDGRLPYDFEPADLERLIQEGPITDTTRSVCRFLLHVWNPKTCRFVLSETFGWDETKLTVLAAWASGEATGQPGRYF